MLSIKKSAGIITGLTASVLFAPACWAAAQIVVNNEQPLSIPGSPGFSYMTQGDSGSLNVATDGFLFCANLFPLGEDPQANEITLAPLHGDWRLPTAKDVQSVNYGSGSLRVNRGPQGALNTTLACHAIGANGESVTPLVEGLFRNGYDDTTGEQYANLINWIPSQGFNWDAPDWSLVPTDPCSSSGSQPAQFVETIACAGATGVRPAGAGGAERRGTMWTGTDGAKFYYVARIDARFGAQQPSDINAGPALPQALSRSPADGSNGSLVVTVLDGYDRGVVGGGTGYLSDTGTYCILTDLPAALDANMCLGAAFSDSLNGTLNQPFSLTILPPAFPRASFYIAFVRSVVGPPPAASTEPVVGVSILIEPNAVAEGGDGFKGDDTVFGFLPSSQGFPWMSSGQ